MNKLLMLLEQSGANPKVGIHGMLDDEEMYLRLLKEFVQSDELVTMRTEIEAGNYPGAFEICHRMKGSSVTLALTPLSAALSELAELLRPYYNGSKKTPPLEERSLVMLSLGRTEHLMDRYRALLIIAE